MEGQRTQFLQDIIDMVEVEEIPPHLIFNWDQTGLYLVPTSNWTMAQKGQKRIRIRGLKDKRMITAVFCCNLNGEFLPIQLIYGGKTDRCHPPVPFPNDWDITHNEKHWSNETTMLRYIKKIVLPFVERVRHDLGFDEQQAALAIFDCFKGQLTNQVVQLLEEHNIQSVLVPANCTDQLQPLDLTVNRVAKAFLQREFQEWYANEITNKYDAETGAMNEQVNLSASRMKSTGVSWLIHLYEHICNNPQHIVNGFTAAGIPQSIDAGEPIELNTKSEDDTDSDSITSDEYDSDSDINESGTDI